MTRKNKDTAWPRIAVALAKVLVKHPNDRVLVHTVSYDLNAYLSEFLKSSRITTYKSSIEKQDAIDTYISTPASVLLAPSLDRGIDLADDDCRAIVVCKVPFPNLGDKQVSARLHSSGGQLWYSVKTVRSLVQMTGRGFRHEDDFCESYILDAVFMSNVWRRNKFLLPAWWRDAVNLRALPL
jgi:Rad3-related DNA helicase